MNQSSASANTLRLLRAQYKLVVLCDFLYFKIDRHTLCVSVCFTTQFSLSILLLSDTQVC